MLDVCNSGVSSVFATCIQLLSWRHLVWELDALSGSLWLSFYVSVGFKMIRQLTHFWSYSRMNHCRFVSLIIIILMINKIHYDTFLPLSRWVVPYIMTIWLLLRFLLVSCEIYCLPCCKLVDFFYDDLLEVLRSVTAEKIFLLLSKFYDIFTTYYYSDCKKTPEVSTSNQKIGT